MPKLRSGEKLQEYRRSYNYREEYFKRNPGLFGCIWFCSQCYKPLIGRKNVVIDHIVPLSKGGRNHVSNCTAICQKCNRDKSDKIDGRIIKGQIFKAVESTAFRGQRGVGAAVGLGVGLTAGAVGGTMRMGTKAAKGSLKLTGRTVGGVVGLTGKAVGKTLGLVTYPLRKGSFASRLMFVALYTLVILYVLQTKTNILDAWLR